MQPRIQDGFRAVMKLLALFVTVIVLSCGPSQDQEVLEIPQEESITYAQGYEIPEYSSDHCPNIVGEFTEGLDPEDPRIANEIHRCEQDPEEYILQLQGSG